MQNRVLRQSEQGLLLLSKPCFYISKSPLVSVVKALFYQRNPAHENQDGLFLPATTFRNADDLFHRRTCKNSLYTPEQYYENIFSKNCPEYKI